MLMKGPHVLNSTLSLSRRRALRTGSLAMLGTLLARSASARASGGETDGLHAAAEYSAAHAGLSFLAMKAGRVVYENYPHGHGPYEAHKIYSGTKGFWILAAMKAVEEGIIDLDDRVASTLPEWNSDGAKSRVTLRQLLNFSSGLDAANNLHGDGFENRDAIAIHTPLVAQPGAAFIYGPAPLQVFHEVLKRKLAGRGETPTHYLERKVLRPLGLGPQRYLADKAGNPLLATGFILSARQWARMGQLILNGGTPIVSPQTLSTCFRGSGANCAYGMGFWNNSMAGESAGRELDVEDNLVPKWYRQNWHNVCLCHAAPPDLVAAIGSGYQRLFVIPSLHMIIVRQGQFGRFSDAEFLRLALGRG
jgi:CubicO group peptidase (beta-lactamase class C family)